MVDERITESLEVRKIPYKILQQLTSLLDIPGERDWKALIAELPDGRKYSSAQINRLEMELCRKGGSPSMSLLTDFGQQLMLVGELITYLEEISNQEALLLLKPHEPVSIIRHPSSVVKQAGQEIVATCDASGFPLPSYQWFKNGIPLRGKCSKELHLKNATEDHNGNYFCKITNPIGSEYTMTASVQVIPQVVSPVLITPTSEETVPVYLGQYFTLNCNTPAHIYQWYKNGYPIPGACDNHLLFYSVQLADEGHYCCKINNEVITQPAYLSIIESPNKEFATGKLALVIANQDYQYPRSRDSQLVHPVDDAKLLQEKLESIDFKVTCLINLTKKEMKTAIDGFCRLLGCAQGIYSLFYFGGHGFEENGKTYLIPVDAGGPADGNVWNCYSAISAEQVLEQLQQCETTKLDVLLLDVCRTQEPTGIRFESITPEFKAGAHCVFGYATCQQSEAFEVRQHANGLYMKHLAAHITENIQIETMLHKVGQDVRKEAERHIGTNSMSPTFYSTTTKVFSLCDKIIPTGFAVGERDPAVEWFRYHRLPANQIIQFKHGIVVEMRFVRELSNVCNIIIFVEDKGSTSYCDANVILENVDVPMCSMNRYMTGNNLDYCISKCLKINSNETSISSERSSQFERWTKVPGLQKLNSPFKVTIEIEYKDPLTEMLHRSLHNLEFPLQEFGIASFFKT